MFSSIIRYVIAAQIFLLAGLLLGIAHSPKSQAQLETGWTESGMPNMEIGQEVSAQYPRPGNRDCYQKNLPTLVLETSDPNSVTEKSVKSCVVKNQLGTFSSYGDSFVSSNTYYSYKAIAIGSSAPTIVGVPNQPYFMRLLVSGSWDGSRILLYNNVRQSGKFELENSNNYRGFAYKLNNHSGNDYLKDAGGNPLQIKEYAFSENGEWVLAEAMDVGLVRIHLPTQSMTLFSAESFRYGFGVTALATLAISNDGKYAIKSGKNFGPTRVYDISKCQNQGQFDANNRSVTGCQERSLDQTLLHGTGDSGVVYLSSVRFSEDSRTIKGLFVIEKSDNTTTRKITLSLDQIDPDQPASYIAMGDSFASGEGDGDEWYEDGTNDPEVNLCHLSKRSYPYLLWADFSRLNFHSVACSGARQDHITQSPQHEDSDTTLSLGEYIPGDLAQLDYVDKENENPSFITLSIGGNDMGFGPILLECIIYPGTCRYADDLAERNNLAKEIKNEYQNLVDTYQKLIEKTESQTKIYVIGYPEFIKGTGGNCAVNTPLDDAERLFVQEAIHYANNVIEKAAKASGVYYVDSEKALEGRNLCSEISDETMAVNGVTIGDDKPIPGNSLLTELNFIGNESFHPNDQGHKLLRDDIVGKVGNPAEFQTCADSDLVICPDPAATAPNPDQNYFGDINANYTSSWRPDRVNFEIVKLGGLSFLFDYEGFKPGASLRLVIESEPTELGIFQADNNGRANIQATIPDSVPPGFHEIHLYGENVAGEKVDYYQQVYVTGPEGDINANDVPDAQEKCGWVADSHQDQDRDDIDDACDGIIGPQATAEEPEPMDNSGGEPQPPDEDDSPDIITDVNNDPPAGQTTQTGASLQPQASQAQPTATGIQQGSRLAQDSNESTQTLLNQGLAQSSLNVVSSPNSTQPAAIATVNSPSLQTPSQTAGSPVLALLIVGGFIVLAAAIAWNQYVKTPVPVQHRPKNK